MINKDFNEWFSNFKETISDYKYFIDFDKVYSNVNKIKIKLQLFNSLIGTDNIENDFRELCLSYPEVVSVIPLLLADRNDVLKCLDNNDIKVFNFQFNKNNMSSLEINQYLDNLVHFMNETGLFYLLQNSIITNVVDFAIGIETGLNSNARKNRGGHMMENLVEEFITKAGFIKDVNYFKEMNASILKDKFNINLNISDKNKANKRFDFVLLINDVVYAIECNFYASSGSKLNETARSYKMLFQETKDIENFNFIWITDGLGWKNALSNLRETYINSENIYNISDLENGLFEYLHNQIDNDDYK
ncbi:type II restriction endonuclease [Mycoplasmopsis verecunda]|uniref:Type-2 restriction enzyme n=1 Tax=Mycoplasmopsis verecunda TaxID=171291 RepID=A0A1T4L656_9BACT|nr:type II restriction endonuclease [Mycoplasmopsis verecunda]WPB54785.1 type II restriction endonuclease [Mycoplasmopsis verecunda]SJZ50216.1 type II restriction enzyme [Mycoplasmopsis verecunda]